MPKQQGIIFDGGLFHTAEQPINNTRCIVNYKELNANQRKTTIDYFDNIKHTLFQMRGPIMEVKLPDEVLDEWLEWSKKYKNGKT